MRSASPNILRHHIPLSFSKQVLDYKESLNNKIMQLDDNPFKNRKLKRIENNKECVMIFKNKSARKFRAKKQIETIPLLRNMKNAKKNCIVMREKQKQTYNILFQADPYSSIKRMKKPGSCLHKRNQLESPYANPERSIRTSYSSFRGTSKAGFREQNMFIMSKQHQHIQMKQYQQKFNRAAISKMRSTLDQGQLLSSTFRRSPSVDTIGNSSKKNCISLQITGSRAPSNEIIDHWKRHTADGFYQLVTKLVK